MDQHEIQVIEEGGQASGRHALWLAILAPALALFAGLVALAVYASTPLSINGYADFEYGDPEPAEATGNAAQSKVWWNDGYWWGVLYNMTDGEYHIYRLDAGAQDWVDTGTAVDQREDARPDALWDGAAQKLYVVSHFAQGNPSPPHNNVDSWAYLYRYSYDAGNDEYTLDNGFPALDVNEYRSETLVFDKDSEGRLWTTWVGRVDQPDPISDTYHVYVSYSAIGNDLNWSDAYTLPFTTEGTVDVDDISALVAFEDDDGPKVGVLWGNQVDGNFYFAIHDDTDAPETGWTLDPDFAAAMGNVPADDHFDFAETATGELFMVVKTGINPITQGGETLIGVVTRESDGTTSFIEVTPGDSRDTRPIAVVDESTSELHVFDISGTDGGSVCQFKAAITSPLSSMHFAQDNCPPPEGEPWDSPAALANLIDAPIYIGDTNTYTETNNPSTTKQQVNDVSGVLVLASDDVDNFYLHNLESDTVPDETPTPTATPITEATPTATATSTPTATATTIPDGTATPTPTATVGPPPEGDEFLYLPFFAGQ